MPIILTALLFLLLPTIIQSQSLDHNPVIPNRWVQDALRSVRENDTALKGQLITEFHQIMEPDPSANHPNHYYGIWSVLQVILADLDYDGVPECLLTCDAADYPYVFCVLRFSGDGWRVVYLEGFWARGTAMQSLELVYTSQSNRVLFYREQYSVSGGGREYNYSSYSILEMRDDSVRIVAEVPGLSFLWGNELSWLSANAEASLEIWNPGILVRYHYTLLSAVRDHKDPLYVHDEEYEGYPLSVGRLDVFYEWNEDSLRFIPSAEEDTSLEQKVHAIGSGESLEIFNAFRSELDSVRATATGRKKELIEHVFQQAEEHFGVEE